MHLPTKKIIKPTALYEGWERKGRRMNAEVYATPNLVTPNNLVVFNEELCTGCNLCVEACRSDCLMPNPVKGKPPILVYPDECWLAGCCVAVCPNFLEGAIRLVPPLNQEVSWKRKKTGETYRIGMFNPPVPNLKPPVGGWHPKP